MGHLHRRWWHRGGTFGFSSGGRGESVLPGSLEELCEISTAYRTWPLETVDHPEPPWDVGPSGVYDAVLGPVSPVSPGDPAGLTRGVEVGVEARDDLETSVESVKDAEHQPRHPDELKEVQARGGGACKRSGAVGPWRQGGGRGGAFSPHSSS